MFTEVLFLIMLIMLNAFFATSEIALISLNDNKIRLMAEEKNKKVKLLKKLMNEPSKFLATIQIGITFAGFLASAFAAERFAGSLANSLKLKGIPISDIWLRNISLVIITVILSYFTLVLGELVPKRLAMKKAESISMFVVRPLNFLSIIMSPLVKLLTLSANFFVRMFGVDPNEDDKNITEEEIRMMVDVGEEKGTIHETEKEMINNIFEFNNKTVTDIMTHRTDISAISLDASLKEVISLINEEKFSRIPIYEENLDNIVGVLYAKDLIQFADIDNNQGDFELQKFLRHPYYVPSSKRTDVLFKELQKNKTHMAIIIDEYGGTAGIVTMEDLMEEIVGNIFDEYDEEEKEFEKLDETTYIVNGTASLDLVTEYFETELPVDEYETLSGFVIGQLGKIPGEDEKLETEFNGLVFKVEEVDEKRIKKIKVCRAC